MMQLQEQPAWAGGEASLAGSQSARAGLGPALSSPLLLPLWGAPTLQDLLRSQTSLSPRSLRRRNALMTPRCLQGCSTKALLMAHRRGASPACMSPGPGQWNCLYVLLGTEHHEHEMFKHTSCIRVGRGPYQGRGGQLSWRGSVWFSVVRRRGASRSCQKNLAGIVPASPGICPSTWQLSGLGVGGGVRGRLAGAGANGSCRGVAPGIWGFCCNVAACSAHPCNTSFIKAFCCGTHCPVCCCQGIPTAADLQQQTYSSRPTAADTQVAH